MLHVRFTMYVFMYVNKVKLRANKVLRIPNAGHRPNRKLLASGEACPIETEPELLDRPVRS
jgi:hypothetical protein